jgi:ankyrin repeat protein
MNVMLKAILLLVGGPLKTMAARDHYAASSHVRRSLAVAERDGAEDNSVASDAAAAMARRESESATAGAGYYADEENINMALINAAEKLDLERIKALIAKGATAAFVKRSRRSHDKSALRSAISAKKKDNTIRWKLVIQELLDAGADVNTKCGWTGRCRTAFEMVLHVAVEDPELMQMFLKAGANPNTATRMMTAHSHHTDGNSVHSVLHTAVRRGGTKAAECAKMLLDAGANVDAVASERFWSDYGEFRDMRETSLHIACKQQNSLGLVTMLLAHGADVNALRNDTHHECVDQAPCETARPIWNSDRASWSERFRNLEVREVALHIAIRKKDAKLIEKLVCAGADLSIKRVLGQTDSSAEELCNGTEGLLHSLRAKC